MNGVLAGMKEKRKTYCLPYLSKLLGEVQVQFMNQGTQSQCTGTTQRDGMGRELGAGFRMRDTCPPMADSWQCMAKITTIL